MDEEKKDILEKHGYALTGEESGVKLCHWVREKLIRGRSCYKEDFYGIDCHRCLQMSPILDVCNQTCLFCWRYQDYSGRKKINFDEPEMIVERALEAQKELVSGFRGDERCSEKMWKEARHPNQVAISLSGEPTLYPYLSDLIEAFEKRGMTTFLVSNGTKPQVLENLDFLPTQLYITLAAPNKKIFKKLCVPKTEKMWEKLMESLEILPTLDTRTVIRHTLVDGWNIGWESDYADVIDMGKPDFVEAKGYVFVGDSRTRMSIKNMPSHEKIKGFAKKEAELLDLSTLAEKKDSRVVLLGKEKAKIKIS